MLLRSPGLLIRSGRKRGEGRAAGWRSRCILRLLDAGHVLDTHSAIASLQVEAVQQNGLAQPREATCAKVAVQRAGRQPFAVDGLKIGKAGGPEALNDFSLRAAGAAALDLVVHRDSGEHPLKLRGDDFRLPQADLPNSQHSVFSNVHACHLCELSGSFAFHTTFDNSDICDFLTY